MKYQGRIWPGSLSKKHPKIKPEGDYCWCITLDERMEWKWIEMNKDEEIVKIKLAIERLKLDADDELMKSKSEAFRYGVEILDDYLKYLMYDRVGWLSK